MSLPAGARLGPYEVLASLGTGGMGEVYRAKDTKLGREVALKVLHEDSFENEDFVARFEREARLLAAVNNPRIAALYSFEEITGRHVLVMELLEGETLAERLLKGPLRPEQVLDHGIEIASALEAAHRGGIVHRDLKPGNVMVTKSGVKLLDFGLAKAAAEPFQGFGATSLPTELPKNLTQQGTILGTFQYMSPEQLEGREADARSDIFSFGAVLYEMATGRKAFEAKSQASLIAAILQTDPPPVSSIQPMTPPALDRVVRTCLAKDPDERWQNAHDLRSELEWIAQGGSQARVPAPLASRRRNRQRIWMSAALVFAAAALALLAALLRGSGHPGPAYRLSLTRPAAAPYSRMSSLAISPDGRRVVFVGTAADGHRSLWLRPLDSTAALPLPGTEGALLPFWSPESRFLGFFAEGKLKKIDTAGGPPQIVADAPAPFGGAWGRGGLILFVPRDGERVFRVSVDGGSPVPLTHIGPGDEGHRWPRFLPDGRHFLFLQDANRREDHHIKIGTVDGSAESVLLAEAVTQAEFVPPGEILYVRGGTLLAHRFDPQKRRLEGNPVPLAENIVDSGPYRAGQNHLFEFSTSESGVIVYRAADPNEDLVWVDRAGKKVASAGQEGRFRALALSPAGQSLGLEKLDADGRAGDLWLFDFTRGSTSRLTFHSGSEYALVWSPDGREIVFGSARSSLGDLYREPVSDPGAEKLLLKWPEGAIATSWSPDGRRLLFSSQTPQTQQDIWVLPLDGSVKPSPYRQTRFNESTGMFSPDGKSVAYVCDESGQEEIYVETFPRTSHRVRVSVHGGGHPAWRPDGRELFFRTAQGRLAAADISQKPSGLEAGPPRDLFDLPGNEFAPSPDGQRLLVDSRKEDPATAPFTVVIDWREATKQ